MWRKKIYAVLLDIVRWHFTTHYRNKYIYNIYNVYISHFWDWLICMIYKFSDNLVVDWICLCLIWTWSICVWVTVKLIQWPASDSTVHSIQEVLGDGEGLAAGELLGFIYPSQVHHYFSPLHFVFWSMPWTDRLTRPSWRNLGCLSSRKFMLGWWNVQ